LEDNNTTGKPYGAAKGRGGNKVGPVRTIPEVEKQGGGKKRENDIIRKGSVMVEPTSGRPEVYNRWRERNRKEGGVADS